MLSNILKYTNRHQNPDRNFILILLARFSSDFGAFLNMVAISSYIYVLSDSPLMVGIFLACRVVGGMFASLISHYVFRKLEGNKPLFCLDLIRAVSLTLLTFVAKEDHLFIMPFVGLVLGTANSLFSIGLNSQLSLFISKDKLGHTNSWITTFSPIGMVVGALSSGLIIAFQGYQFVFMLNITCYLFAALCMALLISKTSKEIVKNKIENSFKQDVIQLKSALRKSPIISTMLMITLADTLGSASHNVGFPILSKAFDNQSPAHIMGYIIATWATGKLTGDFLCKTFNLVKQAKVTTQDKERMEKGFFIAVLIMSSGFIFAFNQSTLYWVLIAFFIAGTGDGISEVCFITRAQHTADEIRLPLFSTISFMQNTGFGLGMLISALSFEYFRAGIVVGIFHGVPIIVVILSYYRHLRTLR